MNVKIDAKKPFWKSKTIISGAIMMITFIIDASFQLGISDTVNESLNNILTYDNEGTVTKINFSALLSLFFMLILRFVTKDPVSYRATMKKAKETKNEFINIDFTGNYKKEQEKK